jgi:hypothetical protein
MDVQTLPFATLDSVTKELASWVSFLLEPGFEGAKVRGLLQVKRAVGTPYFVKNI